MDVYKHRTVGAGLVPALVAGITGRADLPLQTHAGFAITDVALIPDCCVSV